MDTTDKETVTKDQLVIDSRNLITRLLQIKDYTNDECRSDIDTLSDSVGPHHSVGMRVKVTEAYSDAGLKKLFQKIWEQIVPMKLDYEKPENENAWYSLRWIMSAIWNGCDCSPKFSQSIIDTGVYKYIFKVAKEIPSNENDYDIEQIDGMASIMHNVLRYIDGAKQAFREQGAVDLMQTWRASEDIKIKTVSEIILAYLINDDESDMLDSVGQTLIILLRILDEALESLNHVSPSTLFCAEETIAALNKLAANDNNMEEIVTLGALPCYTRMMQKDFNQTEQYLAVEGLWNLSFNEENRETIKANSACMQSLKNLASSSKSKNVKKGAQGALWILEKRNDTNQKALASKPEKKDTSKACEDDSSTPHIMISYNWGNQPTMLRVRDRLTAAGYNIWMDVDRMSGSTLDAMAKAVEEACLVLVCFSMKYKESPNCRTEGQYTHKIGKDFIPLRLQDKYKADGWLGAFLGNELWYDFSLEDKFEASITALIKRIGNRGKIGAAQPIAPKLIVPIHEGTTHASPPPQQYTVSSVAVSSEAMSWKKKEIEEWLMKNELKKYNKKFATYDGSMLLELKDMWTTTPDFFYASIKRDFGFKLKDILRFTRALKTLQRES